MLPLCECVGQVSNCLRGGQAMQHSPDAQKQVVSGAPQMNRRLCQALK